MAEDGPVAVVVPRAAAPPRGIPAFVAGMTGLVVGFLLGRQGQPRQEQPHALAQGLSLRGWLTEATSLCEALLRLPVSQKESNELQIASTLQGA